MTLEQRLDQLEEQNQRIERKNKRLTAALTVMAVAMCAVVTVAAKREWTIIPVPTTNEMLSEGQFHRLNVHEITFFDDEGELRGFLSGGDRGIYGGAYLHLLNASGQTVVRLGTFPGKGEGAIDVMSEVGDPLVRLGPTEYGNGAVATYGPNGTELVELGGDKTGGTISTYSANNKSQ